MSEALVLLVEDNPDDEELMLRPLRQAKIAGQVVVAHDGEEGLEALFEDGVARAHLPAVVLLDMRLPKVSGLDILQRIRATRGTERLPVMVLTSSPEDERLVKELHDPCTTVLPKPGGVREFAHAAAELGLHWLILAADSGPR